MNIVPAMYVSVWDDSDEVATACKVDVSAMPPRVVEMVSDSVEEPEGANACTEEYLVLALDGKIIKTFIREDGVEVDNGDAILES